MITSILMVYSSPKANMPSGTSSYRMFWECPQTYWDFLHQHSGDPAIQVPPIVLRDLAWTHTIPELLPNLKWYILSHVFCDLHWSDEVDSIDLDTIILKHNWIYWHKLMHVNYTPYNVWSTQDVIIFSNSHYNIMLLASPNPTLDPQIKSSSSNMHGSWECSMPTLSTLDQIPGVTSLTSGNLEESDNVI